jgi:uncharacterized protein (DUF1499 family)
VSSYDDRPPNFVAPLEYEGTPQAAMQQLVAVLQDAGATIQQRTRDYVYAVLPAAASGRSNSLDLDLEFVFAAGDNIVRRAAEGGVAASRLHRAPP